MKAQNANHSSAKTRKLIKAAFAEMLSEKRTMDDITVTELVKRADINRGTFYIHYDDIYAVAEDYENELIDRFFDDTKLLSSKSPEAFIDSMFDYIRKNDESYKLLCRSNDILSPAQKLISIASSKLIEICYKDPVLRHRKFLELDINVFIEGLVCEYVKYCRGISAVTPEILYEYTKTWSKGFKTKPVEDEKPGVITAQTL